VATPTPRPKHSRLVKLEVDGYDDVLRSWANGTDDQAVACLPDRWRDSVTIRVLIIARRPLTLDDFGFESDNEIDVVHFARRVNSLEELADDAEVLIVDVDFPEGAAYQEIASTVARLPDIRVLALTTAPPRHEDVARSIGAGAVGFVDVDAEAQEFADAVRAVHAGETWLPGPATSTVLRDVASDLEVTTAERRSRLVAVMLGLVPVAGALAAVLSLLWRRYLGHIGVRPIDIAIDPTTRVVDAIAAISFLIAVFGSPLYIRSWLDSAERVMSERASRWVDDHRTFAGIVLGVILFVVVAVLTVYADLVLVIVIGPIVTVSLLAAALDLTAELPPAFRIEFVRPRRAAFVSIAILFLFLSTLSAEVLLRGPAFGEDGAEGMLVTRFMGFRAQPAIVTDVDDALPVRQRLYLGGNADLYVLVDPCNDDQIEMVSVGSSRIEIIDEISC
jgi:DNA-binding NarL/FixJ family response regulator